jgi:enamine deaminase RidA (YjgF/YER057c/UK114 family)
MSIEIIQPEGWARPRGYSNGLVGEGRVLAIGGQIGWNAQQVFERHDFVGQFDQALANIVAVLEAAGSQPAHVVRMTIFVTDLDAYRASLAELGPIWKKHMGRWYPAMALVGVTGLVETEALLEIETTAVLPTEARQ